MAIRPLDVIKLPFWTLALATGAKSFRDNRVLGSPTLNRCGLHVRRVKLAHDLAWSRRRRLEHLVSPEDRAAFLRNGFIVKHEYLAPDQFTRLAEAVLAFKAPAREMIQGDTITRRIALDGAALRSLPLLRAMLNRPDWRGLTRYVGSFDQEPLNYIQTILSRVKEAAPDPQTNLHADTFHPSVKAWLFLTDVAADEGPFVFVPGSHLMTGKRLAWEHEMSIRAAESSDRYSARGSFRIRPEELEQLELGKPKAFAVPANTLVVADTVGFHARGLSARPSKRVEIWAYGRRNPFLPWTGLDPLSLPGIAEARVPFMWKALDLARRNSWRDVGPKTPLSNT